MTNPDIKIFKTFTFYLLKNAPPNYKPWFFRLAPQSKAPALEFGSWKTEKNRLNIKEAIEWMRQGGNIGIAGTDKDFLVNVDLDGENVDENNLVPTLTVRSRSRTGIHGFYFAYDKTEIPNIPTDEDGEVRANWQYVVAAGSYVPTDPETVPLQYRDTTGYYTVEDERPPSWIVYADLPEFFRKQYEKNHAIQPQKPRKWTPKNTNGRQSALYNITVQDIVIREGGELQPTKRWGCIFHDSTTAANMSISGNLLHCWRHGVSHNGLQALTVLSGYMTCEQAGSPHKGSGASPSMITGDDGVIFHAWLYAKKNSYIPKNDPVPVRAMHYIAKKHKIYNPKNNELLPRNVYNQVLKIIAEEY